MKTNLESFSNKILVVDDLEDNLFILKEVIQKYILNTVVVTTSEPEFVLDLLQKEEYSLILIDIQMPKINGIELCKMIKDKKIYDSIPLLLITSNIASSQLKANALNSGADDFILRPIDNLEFVARVKVGLRMFHTEMLLKKTLDNTENRCRLLFENMKSGYVLNEAILDSNDNLIDYRLISVNPAFENITELKSIDVIGKRASEYPLFLKKEWIDTYRKVLENGESIRFDKYNESLGKYYEILAFKIDNNHFGTSFTDVTTQKKINIDLVKANQIINRSPVVAFLWQNQEGWPVEMVTENVKNLLGYSASEFLNGTIIYSDLIHSEDVDRVTDEVLYHSYTTKSKSFTHKAYRIIKKDNSIIWVNDTSYIRRDLNDNITHYEGIIYDITEKIESEKRIKHLSLVFKNAINEIFIFDAETIKFIEINHSAQKNLGYSFEELHKMTPLDIKPNFNEETFLSLINPLLKNEKRVIIFETVHKRKDKSLYNVEIHLQLIKFDEKPVFVAYIKDLTDLKIQEKEKFELEKQLRHAQKMETIGTLAAGIAHDFNNILSPIMGYTEISMLSLEKSNPLYSNLESILKSTNRAKDLIQQILIYSKQVEREKQTLCIQPLIKEVVKLIRASIPATVEIISEIDNDCPCISADTTQIHQAIVNLCTNAWQSMEKTGGILTVKLHSIELSDAILKQNSLVEGQQYICFSVEDTGTGMSEEIIERIFEPFYTTKDTDKGTGLGLSVVHGIVKSHDGQIIVKSEVGKGSIFEVFLPAVKQGTLMVEDITKNIIGGNEKILIIDDEVDITNILEAELKHLGYDVTSFNSPNTAYNEFQQEPNEFKLLILDYLMPEINGVDFAKKIFKIRPDLPIIIITGAELENQIKTSEVTNIKHISKKPFSIREIDSSIRKILD